MQIYSASKFDTETDNYTAEASELRIPPGKVPLEIGIEHKPGVVQKFVFAGVKNGPEGIEQFNYRSPLGKATLTLFND